MVEAMAGLIGVLILCYAIGSAVRSKAGSSEYPLRSAVQDWQREGSLRADGVRTVFVFFDYECPFCAAFDSVLTEVGESGGFKVIFKHLPQPNIHPNAMEAAIASVCAAAAGRGTMYHRGLLEARKELGEHPWNALALDAGIDDLAEFESCMRSPETRAGVDQDIDLALRIGVTGTPAIFSNGWLAMGAMSRHQLTEFLEEAY